MAKSIVFTEEGLAVSKSLFEKVGARLDPYGPWVGARLDPYGTLGRRKARPLRTALLLFKQLLSNCLSRILLRLTLLEQYSTNGPISSSTYKALLLFTT